MKTNFILLISILLFLACNKSKVATEKPILISEEIRNDRIELKKSKIPPPPPKLNSLFYAEHHLVINQNQELYFYQLNQHILGYAQSCDSDFFEVKPIIQNLQPKDFINLSNIDLKTFFTDNILNKEPRNSRHHLVLASQNDTIKNPRLLEFLKNTNVNTYVFRRTTQEEDTVLAHKLSNKFYFPEKIKWDLKRIEMNRNYKFIDK